jgi:ferric-dicitrate binding protein FerR (iron transport regulator)
MEERIQYLFRQYLNNTCTRKEFEEFFHYINEAGHNESIRHLIKKVYDDAGMSDSIPGEINAQETPLITGPHWRKAPGVIRSPKRVTHAVAACLIGSLLLAGVLLWRYTKPVQPAAAPKLALTKKVTRRSEYQHLVLPDGTQVWLNAASSLEYPPQFTAGKREVTLIGEAYFDVTHTGKAPFAIHTGKVLTTVLGTAFNIKAYPGRENVVVSVNRGKVKVQYEEQEVAVLTKGQQVKVSNSSKPVIETKTMAVATAGWQQGVLAYDDESIGDIIADLERVYDVTIKVPNTALRTEHISTSFDREAGIEKALQVICRVTDTRLQQVGNTYVIQ